VERVPHPGWRNPSHFSGAHGIENCGPVRGELKRITVATDDYGRPTASLFSGNSRRQEVVCLIARGLPVREPTCAHEDGERGQLFEQCIIEMPPALIFKPSFVPIGRRIESIPSDKHGARLLAAVKPKDKVREADDSPGAPPVPEDN